MKLGKIEKWFMIRSQHAEHVVNLAEKLLSLVDVKEKQNFLEIGCGNGVVSKHVSRRYRLNVTGTDVDPEMVTLAQKNIDDIPDIRFLEADATNLPFQDNDFEIVLSFGVMHHISNWLEALREIDRVLKLNGYFIYFDLVFPEWLAKIGRLFSHSYGITTTHELHSFFEKNNFSEIYSSLSRGFFGNHYEAVYKKT
ncbi:class I SAM-dependent methyltransferase [Candidatus Bathyarchaeota archaeon]|nr:class I SAM-dependent methyltransferase [Candidatus Bathyarchaeota archaeon]MCK4481943.1 class I SAM-dependent methyltransferase [Candidatus Bathyarchaeota archaeon]